MHARETAQTGGSSCRGGSTQKLPLPQSRHPQLSHPCCGRFVEQGCHPWLPLRPTSSSLQPYEHNDFITHGGGRANVPSTHAAPALAPPHVAPVDTLRSATVTSTKRLRGTPSRHTAEPRASGGSNCRLNPLLQRDDATDGHDGVARRRRCSPDARPMQRATRQFREIPAYLCSESGWRSFAAVGRSHQRDTADPSMTWRQTSGTLASQALQRRRPGQTETTSRFVAVVSLGSPAPYLHGLMRRRYGVTAR